MLNFFKKNKKYFKLIFMLAVAFIALTQIASLIKQVKPDKLALIFERLTFIDVILIVLTGIISILPMLNYDRMLTIEHLGTAMKLYVISWHTMLDLLARLVNVVFNLGIADRDVTVRLVLNNDH